MTPPVAGGGGNCDGSQCAGCAALTAVLNRDSRKARGEAVTRESLCSPDAIGHTFTIRFRHLIRGRVHLQHHSACWKAAAVRTTLWLISSAEEVGLHRQ